MRRGMILLGFWMCVCMVFLVNAQEHTFRKLYCTDEDRAIFDRYCTQMEPAPFMPDLLSVTLATTPSPNKISIIVPRNSAIYGSIK